jgi:hypothetical protein
VVVVLHLSTPNGVGNWFHKTWVEAEDARPVCLIQLNYIGPFIQIETRVGEMNKILYWVPSAAQECDCDFLTSGTGVIDPIILEKMRKTCVLTQ